MKTLSNDIKHNPNPNPNLDWMVEVSVPKSTGSLQSHITMSTFMTTYYTNKICNDCKNENEPHPYLYLYGESLC